MPGVEGLSNAHAILLATHFCAGGGSVSNLPQLQARFPTCLPLERLFRIILTFLPESTEPQLYTPVLQEIADGARSPNEDVDISSVKDLSEAAARKQVRRLRLLPLRYPYDEEDDSTDPLTQFLIHRAHLIDSETALQPLVLGLLLPFHERSPTIRTWLISSLLPLLRLNYEYHPTNEETLSLEALESLDDNTAVNVFLSMAGPNEDRMDLVKNLRGLVGPWLYGSNRSKRRRLNEVARRNSISLPQLEPDSQAVRQSGWESVNEWLLSRCPVDHESVVDAFTNWDGPEDVDLGGYGYGNEQLQPDQRAGLRTRYGQTGLAVIYANPESSKASLNGSVRILTRVAKFLGLEEPSVLPTDNSTLPSVNFDASSISSSSRALLLHNALLVPSNPLTQPSNSSISFLGGILLSMQTLNELGHSIPCRLGASICLHSNEQKQLLELQSVVASITKQTKSGRDWRKIRQQLLWLRHWQSPHVATSKSTVLDYRGLFWRVPMDTVETEILKTLLAVREYPLAVDIYVNSKSAPLGLPQVETAVRDAIFVAYDNASNGNKTRGGIKKAHDILQAFQPCFPDSVSLKQIRALISATHALSLYSLTLQHGVPFQPVSIRVHPDPLSLVEKVLDQNQKSYTELDDLLFIGRNLVTAGLPTYPSSNVDSYHDVSPRTLQGDDAVITAERRIISLAISSALSSNDFGTAYSYILTRLTPPSLFPITSAFATPTTSKFRDDISWRAVYNAGRYRSSTTISETTKLGTQITHLSQRMELLSLALLLVPYPDPLPEILGAWRRCDEEMSILQARESEEADVWDAKGDIISTTVPGGFGPTDSEQDAFETEQQRAKRVRAKRQSSSFYSPRGGGGEEEAPMGLFDVARGAAMAFRKNAFPLHDTAAKDTETGKGLSTNSGHVGEDQTIDTAAGMSRESRDWEWEGEREKQQEQEQEQELVDGRVRKRDVVSNMVTGGLVSGIGWVLGAQPVNQRER